MGQLVKVEIEVSEAAAKVLRENPRRLAAAGAMVSRAMAGDARDTECLAELLAKVRREAQARGVTDEMVDAELAAWNAERRG